MSSSSTYYSNFDSSSFDKYKSNGMNSLADDDCYNQQKDISNGKKLKFITTNYIDLLEAKEKLNFFGIGIKDQLFVPGDKIDEYSSLLNGKNGHTLTNCNVRNEFGQLPIPTTPYRGQLQHGNVDVEDSIRTLQVKKHACLPSDDNFQNRSFAIFDKIDKPQAIFSVETPQAGFLLGRNGAPTRFLERFDSDIHYSSKGENFKAPFELMKRKNI